ncbi:hypothetical protein ACHAP7_006266 [Fusarium lateritium]
MSTSGPSSFQPTQQTTEGRAAVVIKDWDPTASGVNLPQGLVPLKVQKGEEVWVFRINQGYGLTRRRSGDTNAEGWVPLVNFQRGVFRVKKLPIEVPAQVRTFQQTASQSGNPGTAENCLQATLRELWRMIPAERALISEVISGMSEQSKSIFFHPDTQHYGDAVYNCIEPQAKAIMGGGRFTVEQLRALPKVTPDWPKVAGIYIIIYGDFGGRTTANTTYQIAIYIGQTVSFQNREGAHRRNVANGERSTHYTLATKANQVRMVPLILQNTGNVPGSFLDIAEFSMVALLGSWYAGLFRPLAPETYGAYSVDHETCMMFSRLMMVVSQNTGWNRGTVYGLNWNTPIVRNPNSDMKWTSWYEESTSLYVYRTRRTLLVNPGESHIHWHAQLELQLPKEVVGDAGFQNGQPIHLVVELHKRGDQYLTHPCRYVRFPPMIGRNSEFEKLRALAIKIQWLPPGETRWKQYYIERSSLWQAIGSGNDLLRIYRTGLTILNDIEKVSYTGGPTWLNSLASTGIQFLRYNHLEQKLVVETVQTTVIPWPQDNSMQQNTERLLQLFPSASSPNTVIGARPLSGFFPRNRKSCDICLSQRTTTACRFDPQDNSCQCCRPLNRPCTWSRAGLDITDQFVHGKPLEELGVAVNISRDQFSQIKRLNSAPIELDIERDEHGSLQG